MKKLLLTITIAISVFVTQEVNSQANSGTRYVACLNVGCAIIGNTFCGTTSVLNPNGTVDTYWCVIWEVVGENPNPSPTEWV